MTLLQTITLVTLAILPLFLLLDVVLPGSAAPRGWRWRGLAVTAFTLGLSMAIGAGYHALFGGAQLRRDLPANLCGHAPIRSQPDRRVDLLRDQPSGSTPQTPPLHRRNVAVSR